MSETVKKKLADYGFITFFVIVIVVAISMSDVFLTERNLTNLSRQMVTNGLLSLGMLVVILSGGIDLSVGPIVALAGILAAGLQAYMNWPYAVCIAILAGMACGMVNGVLIAKFKLQAFIVTLATMGAIRGLVYVYSDSPQYPAYKAFRKMLGGGYLDNIFSYLPHIPIAAVILVLCFPAVWFFLNRTTSGRAIIGIGGNEEAVRLAGINVTKHKITAYVISGFFAALAGVLLASKLGIAQPSVGAAYELDAIAAVVIGGGVIGGGIGGVVGLCGGVFALGIIDNLLNLYSVESYYQQILKGLIILIAVLARRKS